MGNIYFAPADSDEPWTKMDGVSVADFSFVPDDTEEFGADEPILTDFPSFTVSMDFPNAEGFWNDLQQSLALSRVRDSAVTLWNDAKREQWYTSRGLL